MARMSVIWLLAKAYAVILCISESPPVFTRRPWIMSSWVLSSLFCLSDWVHFSDSFLPLSLFFPLLKVCISSLIWNDCVMLIVLMALYIFKDKGQEIMLVSPVISLDFQLKSALSKFFSFQSQYWKSSKPLSSYVRSIFTSLWHIWGIFAPTASQMGWWDTKCGLGSEYLGNIAS